MRYGVIISSVFSYLTCYPQHLRSMGVTEKTVMAELSCAKHAQQYTMSKKIWLSMHPRNFGCDKKKLSLSFNYKILVSTLTLTTGKELERRNKSN